MKPPEDTETLIKKFYIKTSTQAHQRTLNDAIRAQKEHKETESAPREPNVWRTIMMSRITRLATAAAIVAGALLGFTGMLQESTTTAYAIDQTIKANQDVRCVHLMCENIRPHEDDCTEEEIWVKLDEEGEVVAIRIDRGLTADLVVATNAFEHLICRTWTPLRNEFVIQYAYDDRLWQPTERRIGNDPRFAVELLHELEAEGKVQINIEQPSHKGAPIRLLATHTDDFARNREPGWVYRRYVLLIDPATKLVRQSESYRLIRGKYVLRRRNRFLEYNDSIDPSIFELEAPEGAEVLDLTQDLGLPQAELSAAGTAVQVVGRYLQALISRDYEEAARLYNGKTPRQLQQWVEEQRQITLLRITLLRKLSDERVQGSLVFTVGFEYEYEKDADKAITGPPERFAESRRPPRERGRATVRTVPGHPDRWVITGGL
jgi:hypothetical protein